MFCFAFFMILLGINDCITPFPFFATGMIWSDRSDSRVIFICRKISKFWYIICMSCWCTTRNLTTMVSWYVYMEVILIISGWYLILLMCLNVCFMWSILFWWMIWPMLLSMDGIFVNGLFLWTPITSWTTVWWFLTVTVYKYIFCK